MHSFVEFVDGAVVAQLSPPDMKSPIQYALTWPDRVAGCGRTMDWHEPPSLDFEPVDHERFPALKQAWKVIETGGTAGAILNAANEAAVEAFMTRRIPFGMIAELVRDALDTIDPTPVTSLDDIHRADQAARDEVNTRVKQLDQTPKSPAKHLVPDHSPPDS